MRRLLGALLTAVLILTGGLALFAPHASRPVAREASPAASATVQPVNAVLGDESFVATYGRAPTSATPEDARLRTHLAYVEGRLRARGVGHLSASQRARRLRLLGDLRAYWQAGVFPRNTARPGRTPVFIDEQGRLCAVGHLIAQSVGRAAAERINENFKYARIRNIPLPLLDEWAEKNGFTRRELAMIQPMYCGTPRAVGCIGPYDPENDADREMNKGVEIASISFSAASALLNGYLAGTERPSRLAAGVGLVGGGAGLAVGLSGRANYSAADLLLAGSSILVSGWSLLRGRDGNDAEEVSEPPVAAHHQTARPVVRPVLVSTANGRRPGLHVAWQF